MKDEARIELTVQVSLPEAYRAWEDVESWPRWMDHLERVERTGRRTARYYMRLPGGRTAAWDTELTMLRRNETIAWSSVDGDLVTYGRADFEAVGPGSTRIRVRRFHGSGHRNDPRVVSSGVGDPRRKLERDLRRFAEYLHRRQARSVFHVPPAGAIPTRSGAVATGARRAPPTNAAPSVPRRATKPPGTGSPPQDDGGAAKPPKGRAPTTRKAASARGAAKPRRKPGRRT